MIDAAPLPEMDLTTPSERADSPLVVVPSWLVSLALHAAVLILFASTTLTGGGGRWRGDGDSDGGDYRVVGLVARPTDTGLDSSGGSAEVEATEPPGDTAANQAAPFRDGVPGLSNGPPADSAAPPIPLPTAAKGPPLIGPGGGVVGAPRDARNVVSSNRIGRPSHAAGAGIGVGRANFFGLSDKATRVVFVLDCSSSMESYGALRAAKAELMACLQGLERTQQFQIIFYNDEPRPMSLDGDGGAQVYFATDVNRTRARQFIDGIRADGGTRHLAALQVALKLAPEAIFFLTDADSELSRPELDRINKLNGGRTRIHAVEFSAGPSLPGNDRRIDNFLKKISHESGGNYRYQDITRFSEK